VAVKFTREQIVALSAVLVRQAGGYLRNPVRQPFVTCEVCTTPSPGYIRCFQCNAHKSAGHLADAVAALTYAAPRSQSGYLMRGYKASPPVQEHVAIVAVMSILGLTLHEDCAGAVVGKPVTHWATVPSLPAKPGIHPLRQLVSQVASGEMTQIRASAEPKHYRGLDAANFEADPLPAGSHVLLMDDTWATGGHAQSAALALRSAGAEKVSILVIARWIKPEFGDNEAFIRERLTVDYDPLLCPWTGAGCP
jgi:hypothetical protein